LQYLFMILAIVYFTDPSKIISSARSMSPALRFHADGEPPYMLQMVCNMLFTQLELESLLSLILVSYLN